jgi:ubiquinone/menaquinone biosynthesis C-methylase UbiE
MPASFSLTMHPSLPSQRGSLLSDSNTAFVGSIPEQYDRYLGPLLFEPYAKDLCARLEVPPAARVLEVACGTGIVTQCLRQSLPRDATLVATDLNEPMIAYAQNARRLDGVEWRPADAQALPFPNASFDAVVCQFGLMFVPDKGLAMHETRRVLVPGGVFAFNVWGSFEHNPIGRITDAVLASFFPADPPAFYRVPFGLDDEPGLRRLLDAAGFEVIEAERRAA